MGRGSNSAVANGGFAGVLGRGRYGVRVSEAKQAQRIAAAENQVWFNSPVTFWLRDPGEKKIQAIKLIRSLTGWGLKASKEFVDHPPGQLHLLREQADMLAADFVQLGGGAVTEITDRDQLPADIKAAQARATEAVELVITEVGSLTSVVSKTIRGATGWDLQESKDFLAAITPANPGKLIVAGNVADQILPQLTKYGVMQQRTELGPMAQVQTACAQVRVLNPGRNNPMLAAYSAATQQTLAEATIWLGGAAHPALVLPSPAARDFARELAASGATISFTPIPD